MQIHELPTFTGTPSSSDYLAIDSGTTTSKVAGVDMVNPDKLTVAEANTGTSTASRIVTPKVVHDYVTGAVSDGIDNITTSATETKWANITGGDGSINDMANHIADYTIVESGTSGDWMYRKYANGFAECFARFTPSGKQGTSYGGMYYAEYAVNSQFPFTFTETPILLITPSSGAWGMIGDVTYTNAQLTKYDTYRGNSGTVSGTVSVHVFGTWQ